MENEFEMLLSRQTETFNTIKDEMDASSAIVLQAIEEDIKKNIILLEATDSLSQEKLDAMLANLKLRSHSEIKQAETDI